VEAQDALSYDLLATDWRTYRDCARVQTGQNPIGENLPIRPSRGFPWARASDGNHVASDVVLCVFLAGPVSSGPHNAERHRRN